MEDNSLKIQLDSIQQILSYCIIQTYNILVGNVLRKKGCISNMQLKEILQKEYIQITDELSSIYLNYPVLACVEEYYNECDFLWESTFIESLKKKQKQKYPPCIWCLGVFYKLVNYILFKGCLLGRFSTSRTASFCFSSTYIARYVHTWKTKIYCTIGKKSPQANL